MQKVLDHRFLNFAIILNFLSLGISVLSFFPAVLELEIKSHVLLFFWLFAALNIGWIYVSFVYYRFKGWIVLFFINLIAMFFVMLTWYHFMRSFMINNYFYDQYFYEGFSHFSVILLHTSILLTDLRKELLFRMLSSISIIVQIGLIVGKSWNLMQFRFYVTLIYVIAIPIIWSLIFYKELNQNTNDDLIDKD